MQAFAIGPLVVVSISALLADVEFLDLGSLPKPAADIADDSGVYNAIVSSSGDIGRMWVSSSGTLWARVFSIHKYYSGSLVYVATLP